MMTINNTNGKVHKNWRMLVDKALGSKFIDFANTKDGMVELALEKIQKLKKHGIEVKYTRCDNRRGNDAMMEEEMLQ